MAYLNLSEETYNNKHKRYEAYSELDNITFYYIKNRQNTKIMIITAMEGYQL